jgi:hypothetical protein
MTKRLFTYVDNTTGKYRDHDENADSLKLLTLELGTSILNETKLAKLIDGADAADEHIHDGRYFRQNQHIDVRDNVNGLGLPVITDDVTGYIDLSFIDTTTLTGSLSHSNLADLGNDDHLQYIRVDGTRAFTGAQSMGNFSLTNVADPTNAQDAATKAYVDNVAVGLSPKGDVEAASTGNLNLASMPADVDGVTLANGDRFLAKDQTVATENGIYVFNGVGVAATRSADQDNAPLAEIVNGVWIPLVLGGATWEGHSFLITSQGSGASGEHVIGTDDIEWSLFSKPFGSNWQLGGNTLDAIEDMGSLNNFDVNFIRNSEIFLRLDEITGVQTYKPLRIGTDGSIVGQIADFGDGELFIGANNNEVGSTGLTHGLFLRSGNATGALNSQYAIMRSGNAVDGNSGQVTIRSGNSTNGDSGDVAILSGTAGGVRGNVVLNGASIQASAAQIKDVQDPTDPQDAVTLGYLLALADGLNVALVADGAISKGDLVIMTGNNIAGVYSTITGDQPVIGVAIDDALDTEEFRYKTKDWRLEGVLTGATAGTTYYWNGTTLVTTLPSGGNANVYKVGVAENATDLLVDVEFIVKRNASGV